MDETAAPAATETPVDTAAPAEGTDGPASGATSDTSTAPADSAAPAAEPVAPPAGADVEASTTETELGPDPLAKLEDDNSTFVLGMVPVIVMAVFALACVALYLHRRRKNWHELDEVLKIDGGDTPIGHSHFTTKDMQEMEPTRPSKQITD